MDPNFLTETTLFMTNHQENMDFQNLRLKPLAERPMHHESQNSLFPVDLQR